VDRLCPLKKDYGEYYKTIMLDASPLTADQLEELGPLMVLFKEIVLDGGCKQNPEVLEKLRCSFEMHKGKSKSLFRAINSFFLFMDH